VTSGRSGDFGALEGRKHCLVVTFRRSGEPVPTPEWAGVADGNVYFRSEKRVGKVKRIRSTPRVLVAPCDSRGKPLGEAVEGRARILPVAEEERAEAAIQSNFGLGRRMYEGVAMNLGPEGVYVEIEPAGSAGEEEGS
jgi:PPOX class probable F420-dependent enzyme